MNFWPRHQCCIDLVFMHVRIFWVFCLGWMLMRHLVIGLSESIIKTRWRLKWCKKYKLYGWKRGHTKDLKEIGHERSNGRKLDHEYCWECSSHLSSFISSKDLREFQKQVLGWVSKAFCCTMDSLGNYLKYFCGVLDIWRKTSHLPQESKGCQY